MMPTRHHCKVEVKGIVATNASPVVPERAICRQQGTIKGLNYDRSISVLQPNSNSIPKVIAGERERIDDSNVVVKPFTTKKLATAEPKKQPPKKAVKSSSSVDDESSVEDCSSGIESSRATTPAEVARPDLAAAKIPPGRRDLIQAATSLDTNRVLEILNSASDDNDDENEANAIRKRELLDLERRPPEWGSCHNQSALHAAIAALPYQESDQEKIQNWKDLLKILLEYGANPNEYFDERNWKGNGGKRTAFQMVLDRGGWKDMGLLKLFLDAGADPNLPAHRFIASMRAEGYATRFPLHTAVDKGAPIEFIVALLEAGANVNARRIERVRHERGYDQDRDESPLHIAVEKGFVNIAACLLLSGAEVDAEQRFLHEAKPVGRGCVRMTMLKRRPIHAAIKAKSPHLVQLLVLHGANKTVMCNNGDDTQSSIQLIDNEISDANTKTEVLRALQADGWSPDVHRYYPKHFQKAVWATLLSANSGKWPFDQSILYRILSFAAELRPNLPETASTREVAQTA